MPNLTLYDQLGDMPILGEIVGQGVAGSRGPESWPKVSPMTRGPRLKMDPHKKWLVPPCPPPLKESYDYEEVR